MAPDLLSRCDRILTALEDLVAQEIAAAENRDFDAIAALTDRTAPLIEFLAAHRRTWESTGLRLRGLAVQTRLQGISDWIAREVSVAREELQEQQQARRTVAQIVPVYAAPVRSRPVQHLSAVG